MLLEIVMEIIMELAVEGLGYFFKTPKIKRWIRALVATIVMMPFIAGLGYATYRALAADHYLLSGLFFLLALGAAALLFVLYRIVYKNKAK